MVKKLVLITYLIALVFSITPSFAMASDASTPSSKSVTVEEAVDIAKIEAMKIGFKPEEMVVSADSNNTEWQSSFQGNELFWNKEGVTEKLKGKDYWAINFAPKPSNTEYALQGDLWVFIDKHEGSIIKSIASQ